MRYGRDMAKTNRYRRVANQFLVSGSRRGIELVAAAEPLADRPEWTTVLAFQVGGGRTDLVAHLVMPTPGWWPVDDDETRSARKWLSDLVQLLPRQEPGIRLTTTVVRSALTGELERWARQYVQRLERHRMVEPGAAGGAERPRGPTGKGDRALAALARDYVELCTMTRSPKVELAARRNLAQSTIQSYLFRARERGLLTTEGRGKAGGQLTPKAVAILNEEN